MQAYLYRTILEMDGAVYDKHTNFLATASMAWTAKGEAGPRACYILCVHLHGEPGHLAGVLQHRWLWR
jgi:hypothetical protein